MRKTLLAAMMLTGLVQGASAAEFMSEMDEGVLLVSVTGEIRPYDDDRFDHLVAGYDKVVVGLDSIGGNLVASINIGSRIRAKRFATIVADSDRCYSGCALIWLAGTPRVMGSNSRIALHAAYVEEHGMQITDGTGNALTGAYLTRLGLSYDAIAYFIGADADDIRWLTPLTAQRIGIDVSLIKPPTPQPRPLAPAQPVAPAVARIGPSYDCGRADTPIMQFICADPDLSRIDVEMVQPYYVLRQLVGPAGWKNLMVEAINFQDKVAKDCGVGSAGTLPVNRPGLRSCLMAEYTSERNYWMARLTGAGLEEARRPVGQHIALQGRLQTLGFLPASEKTDGIYGTATRAAIANWQMTVSVAVTGLLGDADATRLLR